MHIDTGTYVEQELIRAINNKKFKELSNNCKYIVREIFPFPDDESMVYCVHAADYTKPDIIITMNGESHYVSIKTGSAIGVHQELIYNFCDFLRKLGISEETITTILLFHYGDGTIDGTGQIRLPHEHLSYLYADRVKRANYELNRDKAIVKLVIDRLLFKGAKEENIPAEYIYHGNLDYGVIASKTQIMKHIDRKAWSYITRFHIGPICFRPHARYVDRPVKDKWSRDKADFEWFKMYNDIEYISRRYNG